VNRYLIFIFIIFVNFANSSFAIENKILIKINNEIITSLDIFNESNYLIALNPQLNEIEKNKIIEISKNSLVNEKIKKIEVLKNFKNINVKEDFLNDVINATYGKININNFQELIDHLEFNKVETKNIKQKISIELFWNQLIYQKFSSQIKINKKQIKEDILKKDKSEINEYLLSEILFNVENNLESKSKFEIILKSIKENGFSNTANIFSISNSAKIGGNLGWVKENEIDKKIEMLISNLKKDEFTNPILTPSGFLILKVNDKRRIVLEKNLENEIEKVIIQRTNQQLNQFSNLYLNKIKKDLNIYEK